MAGSRGICFTYHQTDGSLESLNFVIDRLKSDAAIRYFCVSMEEGQETHKAHIQGYVYYERPQMYSRLKKCLYDNTLHCEEAQGTGVENWEYISHEGKHADKPGLLLPPVEFGVRPKVRGRPSVSDNGEYSDLIEALKLGRADVELMSEYPALYLRYMRNIQEIRGVLMTARGGCR